MGKNRGKRNRARFSRRAGGVADSDSDPDASHAEEHAEEQQPKGLKRAKKAHVDTAFNTAFEDPRDTGRKKKKNKKKSRGKGKNTSGAQAPFADEEDSDDPEDPEHMMGLMVSRAADDDEEEEEDDEDSGPIEMGPCEEIEHRGWEKHVGTGLAILREPRRGPSFSTQAQRMFEWMIAPMSALEFYDEYWEKKPFLIRRRPSAEQKESQGANSKNGQSKHYYSGWYHTSDIMKVVGEEELRYGVDLNITQYTDGQRKTLDPPRLATVDELKDYMKQGCSVRILCPQKHNDRMWRMLALLEEFWGVGGGSNAYLTPANTQGFAPHYDDIDAFILQTEGAKRWRLYPWRNEEEKLDRFSSPNFSQDEINEPILDTILYPGDVLYFPRGLIHQAEGVGDVPSLHVTISTGQRTTWMDFLEQAWPVALKALSSRNHAIRRSLPPDYGTFMGLVNADEEDDEIQSNRDTFCQQVFDFISLVANEIPFDQVADQMKKGFLHDRQPVPLPVEETKETEKSAKSSKKKKNGAEAPSVMLSSPIALFRQGICRLLVEDNEARLYHSINNSRLHHEKPAQFVVIPMGCAPAVEAIIKIFPHSAPIRELPTDEDGGTHADLLKCFKKLHKLGLVVVM